MSGQQRYSAPNCDVADLEPGDLIAWEGRAIRVVNVYPVEPVDWHADDREPAVVTTPADLPLAVVDRPVSGQAP